MTPQELADAIRSNDDGRQVTRTCFAGLSISHDRPAAICTLSGPYGDGTKHYLDFVVLPDKLPVGYAESALYYLSLAPLLEGQPTPLVVGVERKFADNNRDLLESFSLPIVSMPMGIIGQSVYLKVLEDLLSEGGIYPFAPGCKAALDELARARTLEGDNGARKIIDPTPRVEALVLALAARHHYVQHPDWYGEIALDAGVTTR